MLYSSIAYTNVMLESGNHGSEEITELLRRFKAGEQGAAHDLMRLIYPELHRLAKRYLRKERRNHTLQTTALVNEAYLKIVKPTTAGWNDRNHFLAVAARAMRQILVDYARSHRANRRNGEKVSLEDAEPSADPIRPDVLEVDSALRQLALIAPRQAQLVELHFFGGLSLDEAAAVLQISPRTADKDWALARAWLRRKLTSA
jgi:RNA polymerase sigma factor (TIGR02999 family)